MGLTNNSIGRKAVDAGLEIKKRSSLDRVIALSGNPNVGKSTLFNALTGMNQHTGNWPGKTVTNAQGYCTSKKHGYVLVDIPGTYSLMAHSAEEEVARNFICFGKPDAVVVVCDATCLERNMNLVLQTLEICPQVVVCVNLLDEAKRKHITVDLKALSRRLGVPVVGTIARKKKSLTALTDALDALLEAPQNAAGFSVDYGPQVESALTLLEPAILPWVKNVQLSRWLSLRLLDQDTSLLQEIHTHFGEAFLKDPSLHQALIQAKDMLTQAGLDGNGFKDHTVTALVRAAEAICRDVVHYVGGSYSKLDQRLDRILTSRATGYPVMLLLLALIFWLTISGANYPSQLLARGLFWIQDRLSDLFHALDSPPWLHDAVVLGLYRVPAWVVSVMLPPMAIFFPLFTLLEDAGYLPRVAYNLDKPFQCCKACGKQSLTMWVGNHRMRKKKQRFPVYRKNAVLCRKESFMILPF